ncbi:MAG: 50S ribosomal protein L7/L12 [Vicinamibacteraceae bacterium]
MMLVPMPFASHSERIPADAVSALSRGMLIDAIKATRLATGLGLKESKEAVETYLAQHPNLSRQYQEAAVARRGPVGWLVLAIVLVVAGGVALALFWGR